MAEVRLGRGPGDSDGLDEPVLVDAGVLAGIAGLLVATQLLVPPSVQAQMAFDHQAFDLWTLWTCAFVHNGIGHLLGNVVGFLAAAGVAYVICRAIDARRWFLWSTAAFLTVLPVLVSLTSYAVLGLVASGSETVERGFSGVVAGYVGLIFVAFVVWVARQSGRGVAQAVGQAVVLVLLWLLSVIYAGGFNLAVSGLVVLGFGLSGALLVRVVAWPAVWEQWEEWWPDLRIGVGIVVVLLMFGVFQLPAPGDPAVGAITTLATPSRRSRTARTASVSISTPSGSTTRSTGTPTTPSPITATATRRPRRRITTRSASSGGPATRSTRSTPPAVGWPAPSATRRNTTR